MAASTIPVVDFSSYELDKSKDSQDLKRLGKEIVQGLSNYKAIYLKNHGLPPDLVSHHMKIPHGLKCREVCFCKLHELYVYS